jgi:hypothetical protein
LTAIQSLRGHSKPFTIDEDHRQRTEAGRKKYRTRGRMTSSGLPQSCALSYQNTEGFTQSKHRTPTIHSCNPTIDANPAARCTSMSTKLQLSDLGDGVICAFDERTVGTTLRGHPREICYPSAALSTRPYRRALLGDGNHRD